MRANELPTREQVELITDKKALEDIRDDIEMAIARIQTDLEYSDRSDEWYERASNALVLHRYVKGLVERRIAELRKKERTSSGANWTPKTVSRTRKTVYPLAKECISGPYPDPAELNAIPDLESAIQFLDTLRNALKTERAEEIDTFPPQERDESWVRSANDALAKTAAIRLTLNNKAASIRQSEKRAIRDARDADRQQAFIDSAREILPKTIYQAIWDRVDRLQLEGAV